MAGCFYNKDGKQINDMETLIKMFFEDNKILRNAKIYSSDEMQQSTLKKITNLISPSAFASSTLPTVTEFIVTPNPGLFTKLGIPTGETARLAPEYIAENRIYSFVKEKLALVKDLSDTVSTRDKKYSEKYLTFLRTKSEFGTLSDNKLIYLLDIIEDIMHFEELTKDFGIMLHKVISLKVLNNEYKGTVSSYIQDSKNSEVVGNFSEQEWMERIENITNQVLTEVKQIGIPLTEVLFTYDASVQELWSGVRGKIDLIAIDPKGDPHIFEIKISKTEYKDWDSAKQITLDWQLAMYRQLLGRHVNVENTMLVTIPVWMNTLGNPKRVKMEKLADRRSQSRSGLNAVGELTERANKLIPRGVIVDFDPERQTNLLGKLATLVGPEYKVETGIEDYDVDKIMDAARKRFEKEKKWIKWNNFDDINSLQKGYIESETEEEFREKIKLYVAHVKTQVNRNVSILKDAIVSAIKTGTAIKTSSYNDDKDSTLNHLLIEYLNDEWDVVTEIPEALALGLVILKNKTTGNVNILSLTINQPYADSHISGVSYGDLEYLKSFLFLNEFKDALMPSGSGKVAQILIYNPINSQVYTRNSFSRFKEFKDRMYKTGLSKDLALSQDNVSSIEDIALYNLDVNLRKFNGSARETVDKVFQKFRDTSLDQIDINQLMDIQKDLYESAEFAGYKARTLKGDINFDDDKEVLLALLQVAIASKSQMDLDGDFQRMSKLSLGFSDLKSLVAALYTDDQAKYDKEGRKIQGLVQGLLWTTPDWVASKDLRNINKIMSMSNQHIGEKMLSVSEVITLNTRKFYKEIGFNELSRNVIGDTSSKHEDLWLKAKDGTVSAEFKTKNPYALDSDNMLDDAAREYLQNMLFIINTQRYDISDAEAAKLDPKSLSSLQTNSIFKDMIENGEYFRMPLVRREEVTRFKDVFLSPGKLWTNKIKPYLHELNDFIDERGLNKADLDILEKQRLGFYEMYDVYGRQTPDYVAKVIEDHSVNYFEWNLDTIAHRIAFSKIRKRTFDKKLPIINAYVWWMKLLAGKENEDISDQLQYISDQMSLSVFDQPIIDKEFKDYVKSAAIVKTISTAAMLAFKPASLIKEMTIGVFKGISLAATQIYGKDQFTIKDLAAAYKKLMTIDNKFSTEFNLIDKLNQYYRFANMDVNAISKKLQTDRRGLLRGTGRYMYMCNTIPDYYNRLSIFLAKMIHDGSYEAHILVDGVFKYDPTKDKRFEYYLSNRDKHMKSGKYIPAAGDFKYNEQRQRYILLQQQLNKEYKGEVIFEEEDLPNKAYSEIERTSMKSFTDMAYGYYDKDAQSQANNTWWGMTWLQFMQFWPGKMKMWFAKPIDEQHSDESPMGRVIHDFIKDEQGNKILQYHKTIEREDGTITTETTDEDTGDPVLKWVGTPYEGLYYSVIGTLRDIVKLDFKKVKGNEERNRRCLFALADAGLIFMMLAMMKVLLDGIISENGTDGISGYALNMSARINNKVLNEYNIWQSTLGAVNTEPVFLSWGKKAGGDIWDAVTGDKEIMDVMTRNIGAAEVFKT